LEIEGGQPSVGIASATRALAIEVAAARASFQLLGWAWAALGGAIAGGKPGALLGLSRKFAKQRKAAMTSSAFLVPADVLFYQRNSTEIRSFLREEIATLEPPVVAIAHSLGGIIMVDTLFGNHDGEPTDVGVDLLVTFGSQSSMLSAIGAFPIVDPKTAKWLNIWTRYDFASFLGQGIWPGAVDREVAFDVGFPDSHGKYFTEAGFYSAILEALVGDDDFRPMFEQSMWQELAQAYDLNLARA
jgi:hypothetical protein